MKYSYVMKILIFDVDGTILVAEKGILHSL